MRRRILLSLVIVLLVAAVVLGSLAFRTLGNFAVNLPETLTGEQPGDLVQVTRTGRYAPWLAQYLCDSAKLPVSLNVREGFTTYRVQYRTTNVDGTSVVASGLVAVPFTRGFNSAVLYLHGTNAQRDSAPSQTRFGEGFLIAACAVGDGHILVAPDYIGLGESHAPHPYMYTRTTVSTSIDMLRASYSLAEFLRGEPPDRLYVTGFSQGGHATFAVQRALEAAPDAPLRVTASAPIAGPFHLREISFPQALTGETDSHEFYLGYLTTSYARIYKQPIESVLATPFAQTVPPVFDGAHSSEEITAVLPDTPRELLNPDLLRAYDSNEPHWFLDALKENDDYDWTPTAPIRIFYGDNDVDVLPQEAIQAAVEMTTRGAHVTAQSVGPYTHFESSVRAIPAAIAWFTQLEGEAK